MPCQRNSDGTLLSRNPTLKPIGLEAGQLEQLRNLSIMAESIERPTSGDVCPEGLPEVALSLQHLPNP